MAITVDLHSHTRNAHGKDTVEAMAASAFAKGLKIFGFSEHSLRPEGYVYPSDYQPKLRAKFPFYLAEVAAERERYAGRMQVLLALELDYMVAEKAYAAKAATAENYDYVIGGLHFQGTWGFDCTATDWTDLADATCREHFLRYYHDLADMAETGLFQIAAHPDLIKIFRKETFAAWIKTPDAREAARAALLAMKKNGMAMEISSAALRKGLGEPYPCREIMALARDMDLPVSFGSDAHAAVDVAYGFDTLAAYAAEFGYTESAVFVNRVMNLRSFV